jgi:hypothetical protein
MRVPLTRRVDSVLMAWREATHAALSAGTAVGAAHARAAAAGTAPKRPGGGGGIPLFWVSNVDHGKTSDLKKGC